MTRPMGDCPGHPDCTRIESGCRVRKPGTCSMYQPGFLRWSRDQYNIRRTWWSLAAEWVAARLWRVAARGVTYRDEARQARSTET